MLDGLPDRIIHDLAGVQRNFEALDRFVLALAVGGIERRVSFGRAILVVSSGSRFGTLAVDHGLRVTPYIIVATGDDNDYSIATNTYSDTDFTLSANEIDGGTTGATFNVSWIAVG